MKLKCFGRDYCGLFCVIYYLKYNHYSGESQQTKHANHQGNIILHLRTFSMFIKHKEHHFFKLKAKNFLYLYTNYHYKRGTFMEGHISYRPDKLLSGFNGMWSSMKIPQYITLKEKYVFIRDYLYDIISHLLLLKFFFSFLLFLNFFHSKALCLILSIFLKYHKPKINNLLFGC